MSWHNLAANEEKQSRRGAVNDQGRVTASTATHPPGYAAKMAALYDQLVRQRYNTGRREMNVNDNMEVENSNNNSGTGGASKK